MRNLALESVKIEEECIKNWIDRIGAFLSVHLSSV
jgi:hypothetical protein